jgi:AcrR family transcriptional regulator
MPESNKKPRQTKPEPPQVRPYHHGSLPTALLQAAELVLRREGMRGLTLRAIAREAGVSHTAPKHHFGDMAGVLSELAAIGHLKLAALMAERASGLPPGRPRRKAIGRGYIAFSIENPDLFRLMSRQELLDFERPALAHAVRASARELAGALGALGPSDEDALSAPDPFDGMSAAQAISMAAAWGYVHGLATLLIDKRLSRLASATSEFADDQALVDAAIEHMQLTLDADLAGSSAGLA